MDESSESLLTSPTPLSPNIQKKLPDIEILHFRASATEGGDEQDGLR